MKTKHTPGPWRIRRIAANVIEDQTGRTIANAGGWQSNVDSEKVHNENLANAQLIASAPDMLNACKDALSYLESFKGEWKEGEEYLAFVLLNAINKATGNEIQ